MNFIKHHLKSISICVYILIFLLVFFFNLIVSNASDDFVYSFYYGFTPKTINSIADLVGSQYNHYNIWGGRVVAHSIAQVLLKMDPIVIKILNSIVYMIFITLIYKYIKGNTYSLLFFLLINIFIWFFIPSIAQTIFWITGSANYLWCTTIILFFLYPYYVIETPNTNYWCQCIYSILLFLFGIIAGWTNENTAAGMITIAILLTIKYYRTTKKIQLFLIMGIIGALIGYVFMIIAPGNYIRVEHVNESPSIFSLIKRFLRILTPLFSTYGWVLTLLIIILVANRKFYKSKLDFVLDKPIIFIIGALISTFIMIASPDFPLRSWFGIVTFLLIALGILVNRFFYLNSSYIWVLKTMCCIGLLGFVFTYMVAVGENYEVKSTWKEREEMMSDAKKKNIKVVYFNRMRYNKYDRYLFVNEWPQIEKYMSAYYKIDVKFNCDDL